jgi:hypothetical protein
MNQTAFFNSNIDETAKISNIHDSGNIIPDFTSLIDFTFGSKKILADFLGSKPGFSSSFDNVSHS